jgi:hypothetical protein
MRVPGTKSHSEKLLDAATQTMSDPVAAVRGADKGTLLKAAVIAGGLAALTAASAGISALRRRIEGD